MFALQCARIFRERAAVLFTQTENVRWEKGVTKSGRLRSVWKKSLLELIRVVGPSSLRTLAMRPCIKVVRPIFQCSYAIRLCRSFVISPNALQKPDFS